MIRWMLIIAVVATAGFYFFYPKSMTEQLRVGEVEVEIEVANTLPEKIQGLSGRESLCSNCGMLFPYDKADYLTFVMRGMKFPLDFLFIRDGQVTEIFENVPNPQSGEEYVTIASKGLADAVLEVNAGFIQRNNIKVGDRVDQGKSF